MPVEIFFSKMFEEAGAPAHPPLSSPLDNSCAKYSERKLAIIEFYVILTAILLCILVVFGSCRRRTHTKALKYLIWSAYVLSTYLISYTMGQMQSAPFHNKLFIVWTVFLVIFLGNANSISAYNLEENENRKSYNFVVAVQYFWILYLIYTYGKETNIFQPAINFLCSLCVYRTAERVMALTLASRSYGLVRSSKLVADFMIYEHTLSNEEEVDPTCMKGYNYLVNGEEKGSVKVVPPLYQKQLEITDDVITINKIWQCQGQLLSSTGDPDGRLKDICLSFALCKLLLRRFAGYSMFELSQAKTWNLVRNGLLSEEGDHERVFRVIEVELDFLYDFFYTKYPVLFARGIPIFSKSIQIIFVVVSCWNFVAILGSYQTPPGDLNLFKSGHNVDALVTGIVIIAILFMEVVQYFGIMFSEWAKVNWLCRYVKKPTWQRKRWVEKIIQILCHKKWFRPWERKLGQYSLLDSFNHNPSKLLYNCMRAACIDKPLKGQKENRRIELPVEVKKAIVLSLRTNGQRLSNGEASLRRNGVENEFSWACRLETQTHVIMVWHIATSLCEIAAREEAQMQRESEHFIVATSLSKYCAYLVAFTPRLLPDHAYTTETIFDQVVGEARDLLRGFKTLTTRYGKMMRLGEGDPGETIMKRSAVLAKRLIVGIEDNERRWKILADFWADMMLFVAPSDDITAHAEFLAEGGEFVTHLWALLSHAGMLKRDSAQDV